MLMNNQTQHSSKCRLQDPTP